MPTVRKTIDLGCSAEAAWDAVRDFGAPHRRLCPGVLSGCVADDAGRTVTFANGLVLRELLVDRDDAARRLVYAAVGGRATQHSAALEVGPGPAGGCRITWTTDFLPASLAPTIAAQVEAGAAAMQRTLEAGTAPPGSAGP